MSRDFEDDSVGVDSVVNDINTLIESISKGVIKKRQIKKRQNRKHISKRFMFDEDCCNIRHQLHYIKNLKECFPHNREIREQCML